jgi:type VI secretion system protein ImpA
MPDILTNGSALTSPGHTWLLPVGEGQACGPDLEYDPESLDLVQAAGTPDSQFGPGEPANWARVRELAESLLTRSRDLRVALWWGRARLNLDGFAALPAVLGLIHGLLEQFWDELHPLPDADDPEALARLSVIGGLDKLNSLLGDIRNSKLAADPRLNGLRVRDVEVAVTKLAPRPDEAPLTQGQIAGMFGAAPEASAALRVECEAALASLRQLQTLMNHRFSADKAVDLTTVRGMVTAVQSLLPAPAPEAVPVEPQGSRSAAPAAPPARPASGVHSVETRQDAVRAIDLVCAYLERNEPTNPAQLLLRRAARVIDKNFLELVQELAPDAVKDVARIMGVDAGSIKDQN